MKKKYSLFLLLVLAPINSFAQDGVKTLDDFNLSNDWIASASDGVSAKKSVTIGKEDKAIRLDYDFNNRSGYSVLRRQLPIDFPQDYEISFYIRGEGLKNSLEFKLADKSGDNVWWRPIRDFAPSNEWQLVKFKKRHISFAWGPTKDQSLKKTEFLEFVIAAGNGGKGFVEIDELKIRPIKNNTSPPPQPVIHKNKETMFVDMGQLREFGALKINWNDETKNNAPITHSFFIDASSDNENWNRLSNFQSNYKKPTFIKTTEAEARYLKITIDEEGKPNQFGSIDILPLEFGENYNSFLQNIAKTYPRGTFPRGISSEQEFWTLIGANGAKDSGLISEDGGIELARAGFRIDPIIFENGKTYNWANVKITHSLLDNYLPIPSAIWKTKNWELKTTGFATPNPETSQIFAEYEIKNLSKNSINLRLGLLIRPLQVNAPKQFLAVNGGYSPIKKIHFSNEKIQVNDKEIILTQVPTEFEAANFDAGPLALSNEFKNQISASDVNGLAEGIVVFDIALKPNEIKKLGFAAPLTGKMPELKITNELIAQKKKETKTHWQDTLNKVEISANGSGQEIANAIKTNLAYILMMKEGAILKPGSRSYNRSWIRDGAMIAEGLLRLGLYQEAKDYLDWFTPYQFDNGKIPCCVDFRGSDPVPENDSHGQYIYLVSQIYKYTHDKDVLEKFWSNIMAAYDYMNNQRLSERTEKNQTLERAHLYGLMPPSISHEGYSDKPAYSNWDNFWALRGYLDATYIASELGNMDAFEKMLTDTETFKNDINASIINTQKKYGIKHIAGAADRGDFDATSTTIALLLGLDDSFETSSIRATFDKYWQNFETRRDKDKAWKDYTPYEWRVVSAFTRLGQSARANQASEYFLNDRMPIEWNAFAEVVGREKRKPLYLGDLPHGWVASDFIRSSLDRFAYENGSLEIILGAGIKQNWLLGKGIKIKNLSTTKGKFDFDMVQKSGVLNVKTGGEASKHIGIIIPKELIKNNILILNGKKIKTNGQDFSQYTKVMMPK